MKTSRAKPDGEALLSRRILSRVSADKVSPNVLKSKNVENRSEGVASGSVEAGEDLISVV